MLLVAPMAGACLHQTAAPPRLFQNFREAFVTAARSPALRQTRVGQIEASLWKGREFRGAVGGMLFIHEGTSRVWGMNFPARGELRAGR